MPMAELSHPASSPAISNMQKDILVYKSATPTLISPAHGKLAENPTPSNRFKLAFVTLFT